MKDVMDGWVWRTIQAGLERRRTGKWEVKDVDVRNVHQQFVALPNGLILQMNIDWYVNPALAHFELLLMYLSRFQAVKGGCHSTGALYITICNNPQTIRYLREETILTLVLPGPHEPTLEQLNNVLVPLIHDLKNLYLGAFQFYQNIKAASHPPLGLFFPVCDKLQPELFHAQLAMDVSDLPASRKMSGLQLYTSIFFMCPDCPATFYSLLTDPASFDPKSMFVVHAPFI